MNKIANATFALLMLTSCQVSEVGQTKSSEPVNKNLTIVSSRPVLEKKAKEMKFIQPVKAEVKKDIKPIVKKPIHKTVKINKPVIEKSNTTVEKENNKDKINNKPVSKKYVKEMTVEATAYTLSESDTGKSRSHPDFAITASGVRAKVNVTAAMEKSIPFGTVIELENGQRKIIQDRGGAIKRGKLDILVASRSEARKFGRKKITIRIISWGSNKTHFKK